MAESENDQLSANRSFLFGDGFFETIRMNEEGKVPLAAYHADRISRSASLLELDELAHFSAGDLLDIVRKIALPTIGKAMKIKIVISRQGSGNYMPDVACRAIIHAGIWPLDLPYLSTINTIAVSEKVQIYPSYSCWVKSTSALLYVLAGIERKSKSCDEIILLSPNGKVVEGSFSSICWEDAEGVQFTPRKLGGIDSCQRRFLEDYFYSAGITFSEKEITPEELMGNASWICFASALGLRFFNQKSAVGAIPEYFSSGSFADFLAGCGSGLNSSGLNLV